MPEAERRAPHRLAWAMTVVLSALVGAGAVVCTAFVKKWNFDLNARSAREVTLELARVNQSLRLQLASKEQEVGALRSRSGPSNTPEPVGATISPAGSLGTGPLADSSPAASSRDSDQRQGVGAATGGATGAATGSASLQDHLFRLHDVFLEEGTYRMEVTALEFLPNHTLRFQMLHTNKRKNIVAVNAPGQRGETCVVDSAGDQYDVIDSENISNAGRFIPPLTTIRYAIVFQSPPQKSSKLALVLRANPDGNEWRSLSFPQIILH